jgi:hypothetical protein
MDFLDDFLVSHAIIKIIPIFLFCKAAPTLDHAYSIFILGVKILQLIRWY